MDERVRGAARGTDPARLAVEQARAGILQHRWAFLSYFMGDCVFGCVACRSLALVPDHIGLSMRAPCDPPHRAAPV